mmetsp:Transcript_66550/g.216574  ORF Transcript_66550/g.216574 Transcript_66550/m.216574 type:complete len:110 (+) Transcript_66550:125-454(+)
MPVQESVQVLAGESVRELAGDEVRALAGEWELGSLHRTHCTTMKSGMPVGPPHGCLRCRTASTRPTIHPSGSKCIPDRCSMSCSCNPMSSRCTAVVAAVSAPVWALVSV